MSANKFLEIPNFPWELFVNNDWVTIDHNTKLQLVNTIAEFMYCDFKQRAISAKPSSQKVVFASPPKYCVCKEVRSMYNFVVNLKGSIGILHAKFIQACQELTWTPNLKFTDQDYGRDFTTYIWMHWGLPTNRLYWNTTCDAKGDATTFGEILPHLFDIPTDVWSMIMGVPAARELEMLIYHYYNNPRKHPDDCPALFLSRVFYDGGRFATSTLLTPIYRSPPYYTPFIPSTLVPMATYSTLTWEELSKISRIDTLRAEKAALDQENISNWNEINTLQEKILELERKNAALISSCKSYKRRNAELYDSLQRVHQENRQLKKAKTSEKLKKPKKPKKPQIPQWITKKYGKRPKREDDDDNDDRPSKRLHA